MIGDPISPRDAPDTAAKDAQGMYPNSMVAGGNTIDMTPDDFPAPERAMPKSTIQRLAGLFSAAISFGMLAMVVIEVGRLNWARVLGLVPHSPAFWVVFGVAYLTGPLTEWVIYRRLWGLPVSGIAALLRKLVSNELLLGYLGEVQFYAWARGKLKMVAAPFGAIKDVTILSALTGNLIILAMLGFAWPLVASGQLGVETRKVFASLAVVLVTSFLILLFRQKLFTLPPRELWLISALQVMRTLVYVVLSAMMWHYILPDVDVGLWLVLATLRMLISRLPLIPNKDVVFVGIAVFLLGRDAQVSDLMAMMTGILLMTHIVVGTVFGTSDLVSSWSQK